MAFVKARIEIVSALVGTGIKMSLRKGTKSAAKMTVGVSLSTAKELGWSDKDKIEVLIGEAEHHGLMRLRKNNSAGEAACTKRETAKGAWFQVQLGHQPAFVDRTEAARWCQWQKIEDGWIELVMPKWADETAPRKPVSVNQEIRPDRRAPEPVRRTVSTATSAIMGDPPPGRREMLKKMGEIASAK
jgi:hypothetical protein